MAQVPATLALIRGRLRAKKPKYELLHRVGEGTYGIVYVARLQDGSMAAVKKFRPFGKEKGIHQSAIREISLLNELHHENIVSLRDVELDSKDSELSLTLDYAEYDLDTIIQNHKDFVADAPSERLIKSVLWQLLHGLHYLHANWVIHRDIKPSNVLVMGVEPEYGKIKIGDFGLARVFQSPNEPIENNGVVCTLWYRAPELLLGLKEYTTAIDIWSVGCIFAELITSRPLFSGRPDVGSSKKKAPAEPARTSRNHFAADQLRKIFMILGSPLPPEKWINRPELSQWTKHDVGSWPKYKNNLRQSVHNIRSSSNAFQLLSSMLEYDPAKRISAEEALRHPYFSESPTPSMNVFASENGSAKYPKRKMYPIQSGKRYHSAEPKQDKDKR